MSVQLVIAEKPSVARSIAAVIGATEKQNGYWQGGGYLERLWISSMEDAAIREGFANLRPDSDYDALYQSALCRAKADWLVGINATRLFSVLYHKTLTVGRVQTPTLKMLVDRDAKILRFQKEKYYTVGIQSGSLKADSGRIADAETANSLKEKCTGTTTVCTFCQTGEKDRTAAQAL